MKVLIFTTFIFIGLYVVSRGQFVTRYSDKDTHNWTRLSARRYFRKMILDTYRDTADVIKKGNALQTRSRFSVPFEVGYVWCSLEERYRRMVEKYHTARVLHRTLYLMEILIYLTDVELEYWTIEHIVNSLQNVERRYLIFNHITDAYKDTLFTRRTTKSITIPDMGKLNTKPQKTRHDGRPRTTKRLKYRTDFNLSWSRALTRSTNKRFWWPMEYGWEIDWDWNDDPDFKNNIHYYEKSDLNFTVTDSFMRSSEERELATQQLSNSTADEEYTTDTTNPPEKNKCFPPLRC